MGGVPRIAARAASGSRRAAGRAKSGFSRIAVLVAVALVAVGCTEDEAPSTGLTPQGYGVIEGRITGPDGPAWGSVEIRSVEVIDQDPIYRAGFTVDSLGTFRHPVPYGRYHALVRVRDGVKVPYCTGNRASTSGDTLQVSLGQDRLHLDFDLGGARITVPVPEGWAGDEPQLEVKLENGRKCAMSATLSLRRIDDRFETVVAGMPAGSYSVRLDYEGGELPLPIRPSGAGPERLVVKEGEWTDASYQVPAPSTIRGRVVGSWRALDELPGCGGVPYVSLRSARDYDTFGYGPVDSLGWYEFPYLASDSVCVQVSQGNVSRWLGGRDFAHATRFFPASGLELLLPDFVVGAIWIRFHSPDGTPATETNLMCQVYDDQGQPLQLARFWSCSDAAERWSLPVWNLAPGSYFLRLADVDCLRPWQTDWYPEGASFSSALPVTVGSGEELTDLDWEIVRGGQISWILTWDGEGATSCACKLYDASDSTQVICGPSTRIPGLSGLFMGLVDGDYVLEGYIFVEGRWQRFWYPGGHRFEEATRIEIRDHAVVDLGTWRLPR